MEEPVLNYTASKIALAERKYNDNFFSALEALSRKPSMSGLLFLFSAGGGTEEQFDALFKDGVDKIMLAILSGLSDGGFLPKEAVDEAEKLIEKTATKAQGTSQSSGAVTKK